VVFGPPYPGWPSSAEPPSRPSLPPHRGRHVEGDPDVRNSLNFLGRKVELRALRYEPTTWLGWNRGCPRGSPRVGPVLQSPRAGRGRYAHTLQPPRHRARSAPREVQRRPSSNSRRTDRARPRTARAAASPPWASRSRGAYPPSVLARPTGTRPPRRPGSARFQRSVISVPVGTPWTFPGSRPRDPSLIPQPSGETVHVADCGSQRFNTRNGQGVREDIRVLADFRALARDTGARAPSTSA
jgi:hypothetical protein